MKQEFHAPIAGGVAGKDIINEGPRLTIVGDVGTLNFTVAPMLSEPAKQAQFRKETGIQCCKDARQYYQRLLDDGKFTKEELRSAIRQGSVQWQFGASEPSIVLPWIEPVFEWLLFAMLGQYALLAILSIALGWDDRYAHLWPVGVLLTATALIFAAQKFILRPRRVAIRVREWMSNESNKK